MWNILLTILSLFVSGQLCGDAGKDITSTDEGRDTNIFNMLSGNGIYNPMDPMGFIFDGNNKQYRGNGIDTPQYNPDKFAYRYAGTVFGMGTNPFVPNFINSESINNSPNYADHSQAIRQPLTSNNSADAENMRNETDPKVDKDKILSQLPVAAGNSNDLQIGVPQLSSETFPENIMSVLKMNGSDMFPGVSYNGQPGMIGIGEQVSQQTVSPEQMPALHHQYLPQGVWNVSETRISSPVYKGYPGMEGSKHQALLPAASLDTNTPKPIYHGYPGMLGVGQMYSGNANTINAPTNTIQQNDSSHGNTNQDLSESDAVNSYIAAVPGININNWKGEWPGKTSAGGDWSGDWSDKWPKADTLKEEDTHRADWSPSGNSTGHSSSHTAWDGSWPESTGKDEATTTASSNLENLTETLAALEKLINMLKNIQDLTDKSNSRAAPSSFSQMVSSWKEDMKSKT